MYNFDCEDTYTQSANPQNQNPGVAVTDAAKKEGRKMKKRLVVLLTAAMAACAVAGCGSSSSGSSGSTSSTTAGTAAATEAAAETETEAAAESTTENAEPSNPNATKVVFWNSWTGGDGDTLQALVDKFNTSQSDVYIDMTRTTSFADMLQTNMPTGEAADLILLNSNDFTKYSSYLLPIDDIWDNTSLKKEDFSDTYLNLCYNNDQLYGIPFQISTYMLYYNKDLLEQAGYGEDEIPTTFDEWTEAAEKITALSTADKPIYGSGLFYCYNGQNQAAIQRFGTDYIITGDEENGFKANLLDNEAFANAMIWMKNLYDNGDNPKEKDIDSMMAAGQIGLEINGGWLKGTLDASDINYGIAKVPTVTGDDQDDWALGDVNCFYITSSASDEEKAAAEKFIEWWMTGEGLEASDVTQQVDYSGMTPNTEWSVSMCYLNAYTPTVESADYQGNQVLVDLTPSDSAQVQMFAAPGTLFWSDVATCQADYVQDWVFNGPTNPTYDDVQSFFEPYQEDLESYISEYY
jgi:multiple sugar transport system substrate-binding protein